MNRTRESIESQLEQNIPREVVASRSAGGGRALSYLETWYVIDRLNKVFGNLGWDSETREMRVVSENPARYVATVRITVSVPEVDSNGTVVGFRNVYKDGTGWGSDKPRKDGSVDSPHEMAAKEAESDALKRAAMKLGISMGLGLYEKTGEYVEEVAKAAPVEKPAVAVLPNHGPQGTNRDAINKGIAANAKVLQAKGKKTVDEIKKEAQAKYGVEQIPSGLSDEQAAELLKNLKEQAND